MTVATTFATFLNDQYAKIFGRAWPVIPAALVIAALNVFLFAFDRPWTASDGMRNWGDWLFQSIGLLNQPDLLPPLLYSGSLLNIGLTAGGSSGGVIESRIRDSLRARSRVSEGRSRRTHDGVGSGLFVSAATSAVFLACCLRFL